jgi:hypothetical protein
MKTPQFKIGEYVEAPPQYSMRAGERCVGRVMRVEEKSGSVEYQLLTLNGLIYCRGSEVQALSRPLTGEERTALETPSVTQPKLPFEKYPWWLKQIDTLREWKMERKKAKKR